MGDVVYKSPLDMSEKEWDENLGKATANTDLTQPGSYSGRVNFKNKQDFLKKHGLDKYYEFDGGDLVDLDDMSTTTVRVGYGEPSWDEEKLLGAIESLGKWKRPNAAAKIEEKVEGPLLGSKSKFAKKYPDRFAKLQKSKVYGEGRTAEDVDWDEIAGILGVDLD